MKKAILVLFVLIAIQSCQIREEISFKEDGSGTYEMAFDMSEMMKMGPVSDSLPPEPPIDTLINFASILDEKKDSIAKLSKKDQELLESLRPLQIVMKVNDSLKQLDMQMRYSFTKLDDITKFAQAIKKANFKELDKVMSPMGSPIPSTSNDSVQQKEGMGELFSIAESFTTSFSKRKFTRTITEKARTEALQKKDTTMKADDPFADIMRFKQVYRFPYRVKSVSNANAKILSDFMGVELEANMYELNNDPDYFNIEVVFEK